MKQLIAYINKYSVLSVEATDKLERLVRSEHYGKNEKLLDMEERCNKLWFIKSGMIRKYHLQEGKEKTTWIHCENELVTSLPSYFQQRPSEEILQACEPTVLLSISRKASEDLNHFPEFTKFTQNLLSSQFACVDIATREFSQLDAKGKYEYLRQIAPEMIKRAKLGYIASIMGVTQETLSRIRKY